MSATDLDMEDIVSEDSENENIERFLTFVSDTITFGVSTNRVIEIISTYMIRPLPMVPGYIKGIIGLPANLFYGTGIPACIIIIDKSDAAERKGIFMIDASHDFVKDGMWIPWRSIGYCSPV